MKNSKTVTIWHLNDLLPEGTDKDYTYDVDEDECQVTLTFPTRASLYEFIQDVCNLISKEIEAYKPNAPLDDSTYDIQNAIQELVKIEKLGSEEEWD